MCRQKKMDCLPLCKGIINKKPCRLMYCKDCLRTRYTVKVEEVEKLGDWSCPKCRDICNCSICRRRKGLKPTGTLSHTVEKDGCNSVPDLKGSEIPEPEQMNTLLSQKDEESNKKISRATKNKTKRLKRFKGNGSAERTTNEEEIVSCTGNPLLQVAGIELSDVDIEDALLLVKCAKLFSQEMLLQQKTKGAMAKAVRSTRHGAPLTILESPRVISNIKAGEDEVHAELPASCEVLPNNIGDCDSIILHDKLLIYSEEEEKKLQYISSLRSYKRRRYDMDDYKPGDVEVMDAVDVKEMDAANVKEMDAFNVEEMVDVKSSSQTDDVPGNITLELEVMALGGVDNMDSSINSTSAFVSTDEIAVTDEQTQGSSFITFDHDVPVKPEEDIVNAVLQKMSVELEDEVSAALQELKRSQQIDYDLVERKLHAQKDLLLYLYEQLENWTAVSNFRDSFKSLDDVLNRIDQFTHEEDKFQTMLTAAKGVGETPKSILNEYFGLPVKD